MATLNHRHRETSIADFSDLYSIRSYPSSPARGKTPHGSVQQGVGVDGYRHALVHSMESWLIYRIGTRCV